MTDFVPKLTDVSSLKAASSLLALPLLCVVYVLQDGPQIAIDGTVLLGIPSGIDQIHQVRWLLAIFVLKALWAAFWGGHWVWPVGMDPPSFTRSAPTDCGGGAASSWCLWRIWPTDVSSVERRERLLVLLQHRLGAIPCRYGRSDRQGSRTRGRARQVVKRTAAPGFVTT